MPEAVIVSTARSPIGRAMKGSLRDMRPDDLAVQMVRAALDKVPALDPRDIDDLMMGCGQPGGEAGCTVGLVATEGNPNANDEARKIADEKAKAFQCGKDARVTGRAVPAFGRVDN